MSSSRKLPNITLTEVSCIQYEPLARRSKDEAERIAILEVCRKLKKRDFFGGILLYALSHRTSGHVHVAVAANDEDENLICKCCKEAQRPIRRRRGPLRYKVCNCSDCVACDGKIRFDLEQLTRR